MTHSARGNNPPSKKPAAQSWAIAVAKPREGDKLTASSLFTVSSGNCLSR
jgi:hypothetical protein